MAKTIKVKVIQTPTPPVDIEDNNYRKWNFRLALASFILSFFLAVVAVVVLFLTIDQRNSALQSARASDTSARAAVVAAAFADSTYKETKSYNDSTLKRQEADGILQNKQNRERFIVDSLSFASQITSLNQTQKRFEIENEPYLEGRNYQIVYNKEDSTAYWSIVNLGKHPVQVIKKKVWVTIGYDVNINELMKTFQKFDYENSTSIITSVAPMVEQTEIILSKKEIDEFLIRKNSFIYVMGEIHYINLINGKPKTYKFLVRTRALNKVGYSQLYSENKSSLLTNK